MEINLENLEHLELPEKWYSIEEAAFRLTCTLRKSVSVNDILKLVLIGQLNIYWKSNKEYRQMLNPESVGNFTPILLNIKEDGNLNNYIISLSNFSEKKKIKPPRVSYQIEGRRRLALVQQNELIFLRTSLEEYEKHVFEENSISNDNEQENPKSRNNLMRIVYGLAKIHYNYDVTVEKSRKPSEISRSIETVGVKYSSSRMAKLLKEAAELVNKSK